MSRTTSPVVSQAKRLRARASTRIKRKPGSAHPKTRPAPPPRPRPPTPADLPGPFDQNVFTEIPPAGQPRLVFGRSGDHAAVYQTLLAVFQGPSRDEFHAQTEDPFYEPNDRLLVKRGYRVLSHVHLTRRTMQFGQVALPFIGLHWLATLPEFRSYGFATRLLVEAERRIIDEGAAIGVLRTRIPRFFHRLGWAVCGRHSFSQAKAREVLACLHADQSPSARPLNIRLWRHVEMPALLRLYRQNARGAYGPLERTESYWRWQINRRAFDSLLVALDGPDRLELEETIAPIVGYAVLRQEQVVELMTAPGHLRAGRQLLARACTDAIEHDRQSIVMHAPPNDPLHHVVCQAGGVHHLHEIDDQADVFMVRIAEPLKFLGLLRPELDARAKRAGLPRDADLGLLVDGAKWAVVNTRRGIRIRTGKLGRSYLTLNRAEFTRLALGHGSVRQTRADGRLAASTQTAVELADALFPQLPFWRPTWDDLAT